MMLMCNQLSLHMKSHDRVKRSHDEVKKSHDMVE